MSSPDFSSAPYPSYAEEKAGPASFSAVARPRDWYWLHGFLFALTMLTTTMVGVAFQSDFDRNLPFDIERSFQTYVEIWRHPALLVAGLPFSLTLLAILLAHEFGHYLACMYYRVDASLPYFLPAPSIIGTFGAFIRIRAPIYSKRTLFDIGVAGPLAGFIFLLPALGVGLALSKVIPGIDAQSKIHFAIPLLQRLLEGAIFPTANVADVCLHPVARAAWIGIFATALNLLPIGQLDGGHVIYALMSERHRKISTVAVLLLSVRPLFTVWLLGDEAGWVWLGWAAVLFWLGRRHPVIFDPSDLGDGRQKLALATLVIFILCFVPPPITDGGL